MEGETRHESGLTFLTGGGNRTSGPLSDKLKCWGQLLNKPSFTTVDGLRGQLGKLDRVHAVRVGVDVVGDGDYEEDPGHVAIRSEVSGKIYAYASPKYRVVQDDELAGPVVDFVARSGLRPIGRADGVGSGQTRVHVVLANPEFKVRILEEYQDDVMLGLRFWNSYDTTSSFGVGGFGVRMVCCNYNLWGNLLGEVKGVHVSANAEDILARTGKLVAGFGPAAARVRSLAKAALGRVLVRVEAEDLLWGIRFPIRGIEQISGQGSEWTTKFDRDVEEDTGLNLYTLHNRATAYLTWGVNVGQLHNLEAYSARVATLLELDSGEVGETISRGQELKAAYAERVKRERAAKAVAEVTA